MRARFFTIFVSRRGPSLALWLLVMGMALASRPALAAADPALLGELSELAGEVMRRYPPDQYYYVGLGRSPAGLMKMLEARGAGGKNIPLSKMGHIRAFDQTKLRNFLFHHFDRTLPNAAALAGRKMVIIDWANKGGTLVNTKKFFDEYVAARGRPAAAAEFLALHHRDKRVPFINYKLDKVEQIPLADELGRAGIRNLEVAPETALGKAFGGGSAFDLMAEFPSFDVEAAMNDFAKGLPDRPVPRRAEYDAFGAEIRDFFGKGGPGAGLPAKTKSPCERHYGALTAPRSS